jgi:hypothetical protein
VYLHVKRTDRAAIDRREQTLAIVIAQRHRSVERASDAAASDDEENGDADGASAALDKPQVKTTDYGVFGLERLAEESLFFFTEG